MAEVSGLSASTLRFYEDEGLILSVPRDGAGNRRYGESEIGRVNTIRCLRASGLSLPEMKRYFSMVGDEEDTLRVRREILRETQKRLRDQHRELKRCMDYLALKLDHYDQAIEAVKSGKKPPVFSARALNRCFEGGNLRRAGN